MEWATLEQLLKWADDNGLEFDNPTHLHLFGEPLLHREFAEMAAAIGQVAPSISFSTNMRNLTRAWAKRLSQAKFTYVTLSPHAIIEDEPKVSVLYRIERSRQLLHAEGIPTTIHGGPDHDWAGQVTNPATWAAQCEFSREGKIVVRWDGSVAQCCITDSEKGVIGSVYERELAEPKPFELCETCHLEWIGEESFTALTAEGRSQ